MPLPSIPQDLHLGTGYFIQIPVCILSVTDMITEAHSSYPSLQEEKASNVFPKF